MVTWAGDQSQYAGSALPIQPGREPAAGSVVERRGPNTHRARSSSTSYYQPADYHSCFDMKKHTLLSLLLLLIHSAPCF